MKTDPNLESRILDKVHQLFTEQMIEVEEFIDSLRQNDLDTELTLASTKIAESVFDKIWNNPEDADYDDL